MMLSRLNWKKHPLAFIERNAKGLMWRVDKGGGTNGMARYHHISGCHFSPFPVISSGRDMVGAITATVLPSRLSEPGFPSE